MRECRKGERGDGVLPIFKSKGLNTLSALTRALLLWSPSPNPITPPPQLGLFTQPLKRSCRTFYGGVGWASPPIQHSNLHTFSPASTGSASRRTPSSSPPSLAAPQPHRHIWAPGPASVGRAENENRVGRRLPRRLGVHSWPFPPLAGEAQDSGRK